MTGGLVGPAEVVAGLQDLAAAVIHLVVPDVPDQGDRHRHVVPGGRPPLRRRHQERPGHVLVGVGRPILAVARQRAGGRVVPVHEAVAVHVRLRIVPERVEYRLIVEVDGVQHPVGDSLRDRVVAVLDADDAPAGVHLGLPVLVRVVHLVGV